MSAKIDECLKNVQSSSVGIHSMSGFAINFSYIRHPMHLGSYVPYPAKLKGKESVFNPESEGDECLLQCIAAYKNLALGRTMHNVRHHYKSLRWCRRFVVWADEIRFPVSFDNLKKIEKLNKISIYIYTVTHESNRYYLSLARKSQEKYADKVPLLLLEGKHLCLIKDFDKFVKSINNHSERIPNTHKFCKICLLHAPLDEIQAHEESCTVSQVFSFYNPSDKISFKNYGRTYSPTHTAYYDFECLLDRQNPRGMVECKHKAIAYAYMILDREFNVVETYSYVGPDAVNHFITKLEASWKAIHAQLPNFPKNLSREQERMFQRQNTCQLCHQTFKDKKDKHRHHNHAIQENNYLGAYCARCNLQCKNARRYLTTFSHNAAYDLGIILKELSKNPHRDVEILTKEGLKFMQVIIGKLKFLDSLALLNGSLGTLASEHVAGKKPTKYTEHILNGVSDEAKALLIKGKQSLCYDYISSMDMLDEPQLPSRDKFYNVLHDSPLSEEDYNNALKVFNLGNCTNIKDYLMLYLKVDVGMLVDIFTLWRTSLKEIYELDIVFYVSLPSYAWDAFLFKSKVVLDYVYDQNIYDLLRRNLRGGFTSSIRQFTQAVNEHTTSNPSSDDDTHILYLDFNSLYAACMAEVLPQGGIRQLTDLERDTLLGQGLQHIPCDQDKGYWILCDTKHVSPEVARYTDDLPLVLSHTNITEEFLSEYSKKTLNDEKRKLPPKNTKLIASHLPQNDYLVSLDFLQLLLKLGLEVERVKTIYEFNQAPYLKDFISTNIRERANTTCKVKGKAFKLISNSLYGKSMTNISRYANTHHLVTTKHSFLTHARNPLYKRAVSLGQDRVLCTVMKDILKVTTPSYMGYQILQIAKRRLYEFWYNVVKAHYGERARLIYTDTDSFIFTLTCKDAFQEMTKAPLVDYMDFSNFDKDHPMYSATRKGELGLLKSEVKQKIITELIALKPKTYSLLTIDNEHLCKCKGIPYHQQKKITHASFQNTLETNTTFNFVSRSIRNVNGQICTCKTTKRGLSAFDDKRYLISPTESLAYGHPDIPEREVRVQVEEEVQEEVQVEEEVQVGDPVIVDNPQPRRQLFPIFNLWEKRDRVAQQLFPNNNN
ncbi:uncharacterized protein [Procambarus clarkii]|uniref:uncharacterized protein n=1 Tax=Procambarus clarkii TaxID=6728 RepID=UPI0037428FE2